MVELKGTCNLEKLERALQVAIRRHEAFHLRFNNEGTYQKKHAATPLNIPHHNLSILSETSRQERLEEMFYRMGTTPFDLVNGPLIRVEIVKMTDEHHIVLLACHHIVCDGWSWDVLLEEAGKAYTGLCNGTVYELEKAISFSSFVMSERQSQSGHAVQRAYDYWLDLLTDLPLPLELPLDNPRPAVRQFTGSTVTYTFPQELHEAIKRVAIEQKVSLFTLLFGAFNLLLAKLSRQSDIIVTVPAAGQLAVGEKSLVGNCINVLPIRTRLHSDRSVHDLLRQIRESIVDAYDHQEATFGGIVNQLDFERDMSRTPLSGINFNLDRDGSRADFSGLDIAVLQTPKEASYAELFFNLNEQSSGLKLDCDFNSTLFTTETIERWCELYQFILEQIITDPTVTLKEIRSVPSPLRQQMLHDWNRTTADYPCNATIHQLFEEQAERTPSATALICHSQDGQTYQVSYAELNQRANQLARFLQKIVATENALVGVYLERSDDLIAGLLGILKSGAGYIPMDPMFPQDRVLTMADDGSPVAILTDTSSSHIFHETDVPLLLIDQDRDTILAEEVSNLNIEIDSAALAYVIYTSGSTGKPKGVEISHQSVVNFLSSMADAPGLSADDTLLSVTTISFDIAVLELFLPLIVGAKVKVASQERSLDADWLIGELQKATIMQATPATWQMMLSAGWQGKHSGLKILVGGEALPRELADQLLARCESLWNMYGPTETTIWSTIQHVTSQLLESSPGTIPIGYPIANTTIYILDEELEPVPIGVTGDLYIGGEGLARGYRNRPELTGDRFAPNPFSNGLIYKTGDLARYRGDGSIDFLGRSDFQVKIRGFRIELGDIEAKLTDHELVREAVVTSWADSNGTQYLAAYLVLNEPQPSVSHIREYLRTRLPDYMVPAAFVFMDALPLTANGKVARNALSEPESARPNLVDNFVEPYTPNEIQIAEIWKAVLDIPRVGVEDNFFDLGGHSLQATRVITRLRNAFAVDVSLRTFFEHPTIQTMAIEITHKQLADINSDELDELLSSL